MKLKGSTLKRYATHELLERDESGSTPIYFHSARCESFCDYACNGLHGSDIADAIEAMESRRDRARKRKLR